MTVLDANILIAYLDRRDAHHRPTLLLLDSLVADGFRAGALTVAEALVYPARHGSDASSLASLESIGLEVVPVTSTSAIVIARLRASTGLRMPDAVVLHLAMESQSSLATFDEALARVAREVGVEVVGA